MLIKCLKWTPCLPVHSVVLIVSEVKVTDLKPEERVDLLLCEPKHPWCDWTAQPWRSTSLPIPLTSYVHRDWGPKELGKVPSLSKQLDPAAQINGYENVDLEIHLSAY